MIFDRNDLISGSSIEHTEGTTQFTIQATGIYLALFQGNFHAAPGDTLPAYLNVTLRKDGTTVPNGAADFIFQTATESASLSFAASFSVTATPSVVEVIGGGANYLCSTLGITIYRLGAAAGN